MQGLVLIVVLLLAGMSPANAQQGKSGAQERQKVIIIDRSQLRAPPPSIATPPYPPPRPEIGAPMPSPPPLPPMAPRVGN